MQAFLPLHFAANARLAGAADADFTTMRRSAARAPSTAPIHGLRQVHTPSTYTGSRPYWIGMFTPGPKASRQFVPTRITEIVSSPLLPLEGQSRASRHAAGPLLLLPTQQRSMPRFAPRSRKSAARAVVSRVRCEAAGVLRSCRCLVDVHGPREAAHAVRSADCVLARGLRGALAGVASRDRRNERNRHAPCACARGHHSCGCARPSRASRLPCSLHVRTHP